MTGRKINKYKALKDTPSTTVTGNNRNHLYRNKTLLNPIIMKIKLSLVIMGRVI